MEARVRDAVAIHRCAAPPAFPACNPRVAFPSQRPAPGSCPLQLLPLSYVLLLVVLYGFGVQPASRVLLSIYGICASFAYLRFFQPRNGGKGDASEAFTFPDMFPVVMQ